MILRHFVLKSFSLALFSIARRPHYPLQQELVNTMASMEIDGASTPDVENQLPTEETKEEHWWNERTIKTRIVQGVAIACVVKP